MLGSLAAKALVLAAGVGAGVGFGELGAVNYNETVEAHKKDKSFSSVTLATISQSPGKGIIVGQEKTNIGGWEGKTRIGGKASGGGRVGENDVDIIFTQNSYRKGKNGNSFEKSSDGVSSRHVCILLGRKIVEPGSSSSSGDLQQSSQLNNNNDDSCWNYSKWVSRIKSNGEWYDIMAKGQNGSKVFLDSTKDPSLGILELDKNQNNKVKGALGRKGWILGLKVNDPSKWCKVSYQKDKDQWRENWLGLEANKRNAANMKKIGFDFARQSIMVWDETNGRMTSGWESSSGYQNNNNNGKTRRFMEVINCYKV